MTINARLKIEILSLLLVNYFVGREERREERIHKVTNIIPNQNLESKTILDKKKPNFQIRVILKGEVRVLWQEVRFFLIIWVSD